MYYYVDPPGIDTSSMTVAQLGYLSDQVSSQWNNLNDMARSMRENAPEFKDSWYERHVFDALRLCAQEVAAERLMGDLRRLAASIPVWINMLNGAAICLEMFNQQNYAADATWKYPDR